jgi:FixJ family two-component response regulator
VGYDSHLFSTPHEFLQATPPEGPACMILDVRLPGQSGLDLQSELTRRNLDVPIIFVTAHGDIPMTVRALKAGAVDFLSKPFRDQDLLDAVRSAIQHGRARRVRQTEVAEIRARYATLSAREREVLDLISTGKLNKQVAAALRVSEITVKVHRAQMKRKMNASSIVDLVRMMDVLASSGARSSA